MFNLIFQKKAYCILCIAVLFGFHNALSAQPQKSNLTASNKKKQQKSAAEETAYTLFEYNAAPISTPSHKTTAVVQEDIVVDDDSAITQKILDIIQYNTLFLNKKIITENEIDSIKDNTLVATNSVKTEKDTSKTQILVAETSSDNRFFKDSACIDLVIDTVSVIQITEKFIELEYTIINKGTASAPMFGTKKTFKDNVAVHFYFSGTPRLNRGSIIAEAMYLTEGLKQTKGILAPNERYKNRIKLSLEKRSRFYGVIILQLDAFDILRHECDETNNNYSIVPRWY
jgi:hypothetical protein